MAPFGVPPTTPSFQPIDSGPKKKAPRSPIQPKSTNKGLLKDMQPLENAPIVRVSDPREVGNLMVSSQTSSFLRSVDGMGGTGELHGVMSPINEEPSTLRRRFRRADANDQQYSAQESPAISSQTREYQEPQKLAAVLYDDLCPGAAPSTTHYTNRGRGESLTSIPETSLSVARAVQTAQHGRRSKFSPKTFFSRAKPEKSKDSSSEKDASVRSSKKTTRSPLLSMFTPSLTSDDRSAATASSLSRIFTSPTPVQISYPILQSVNHGPVHVASPVLQSIKHGNQSGLGIVIPDLNVVPWEAAEFNHDSSDPQSALIAKAHSRYGNTVTVSVGRRPPEPPRGLRGVFSKAALRPQKSTPTLRAQNSNPALRTQENKHILRAQKSSFTLRTQEPQPEVRHPVPKIKSFRGPCDPPAIPPRAPGHNYTAPIPASSTFTPNPQNQRNGTHDNPSQASRCGTTPIIKPQRGVGQSHTAPLYSRSTFNQSCNNGTVAQKNVAQASHSGFAPVVQPQRARGQNNTAPLPPAPSFTSHVPRPKAPFERTRQPHNDILLETSNAPSLRTIEQQYWSGVPRSRLPPAHLENCNCPHSESPQGFQPSYLPAGTVQHTPTVPKPGSASHEATWESPKAWLSSGQPTHRTGSQQPASQKCQPGSPRPVQPQRAPAIVPKGTIGHPGAWQPPACWESSSRPPRRIERPTQSTQSASTPLIRPKWILTRENKAFLRSAGYNISDDEDDVDTYAENAAYDTTGTVAPLRVPVRKASGPVSSDRNYSLNFSPETSFPVVAPLEISPPKSAYQNKPQEMTRALLSVQGEPLKIFEDCSPQSPSDGFTPTVSPPTNFDHFNMAQIPRSGYKPFATPPKSVENKCAKATSRSKATSSKTAQQDFDDSYPEDPRIGFTPHIPQPKTFEDYNPGPTLGSGAPSAKSPQQAFDDSYPEDPRTGFTPLIPAPKAFGDKIPQQTSVSSFIPKLRGVKSKASLNTLRSTATAQTARSPALPSGPEDPGWADAVKYVKKQIAAEAAEEKQKARSKSAKTPEGLAEKERQAKIKAGSRMIKRSSRFGWVPCKPFYELTQEDDEAIGLALEEKRAETSAGFNGLFKFVGIEQAAADVAAAARQREIEGKDVAKKEQENEEQEQEEQQQKEQEDQEAQNQRDQEQQDLELLEWYTENEIPAAEDSDLPPFTEHASELLEKGEISPVEAHRMTSFSMLDNQVPLSDAPQDENLIRALTAKFSNPQRDNLSRPCSPKNQFYDPSLLVPESVVGSDAGDVAPDVPVDLSGVKYDLLQDSPDVQPQQADGPAQEPLSIPNAAYPFEQGPYPTLRTVRSAASLAPSAASGLSRHDGSFRRKIQELSVERRAMLEGRIHPAERQPLSAAYGIQRPTTRHGPHPLATQRPLRPMAGQRQLRHIGSQPTLRPSSRWAGGGEPSAEATAPPPVPRIPSQFLRGRADTVPTPAPQQHPVHAPSYTQYLQYQRQHAARVRAEEEDRGGEDLMPRLHDRVDDGIHEWSGFSSPYPPMYPMQHQQQQPRRRRVGGFSGSFQPLQVSDTSTNT